MTNFEKESFTTESSSNKNVSEHHFSVASTIIPTFLRKKTKKWNRHEDIQLSEYISEYGENWAKIKKYFPDKSESEIKHRYMTHFSPNLNKEKFTQEEDETIVRLQVIHGNKWTLIAKSLPNRNANMIKNRYHSKLKHNKKEKNQKKVICVNSFEQFENHDKENKIFNIDFNESTNTLGDSLCNENTSESLNDKIVNKINTMLAIIYKMKNEINQQYKLPFNDEDFNNSYSIDKEIMFKEYDSFL